VLPSPWRSQAGPATQGQTPKQQKRLIGWSLGGGFMVDGGRDRCLGERARVLGFESLRGYLQARCDDGYSIPGSPPSWGWGTGRCRRH